MSENLLLILSIKFLMQLHFYELCNPLSVTSDEAGESD
jgi:hypothetical protein